MTLPELYKEYQYRRKSNSIEIRIPEYQRGKVYQIEQQLNSFMSRFSFYQENGLLTIVYPEVFASCNSLTSIAFPTCFEASTALSRVDAIKIIDEIDFLLNSERLYL